MVEILDQKILYRVNSYARVRRYLRGIHPERGVISMGLTGFETIEEIDVIFPTQVVTITGTDSVVADSN